MPIRNLRFAARLVAAAILALAAGAPRAAAQLEHDHPRLSNDGVKILVGKGFTDDLILEVIAASDTRFDISPEALLGLKEAGVSDQVLSAMLKAESRKRDEARAELALRAVEAASVDPPPAAAPAEKLLSPEASAELAAAAVGAPAPPGPATPSGTAAPPMAQGMGPYHSAAIDQLMGMNALAGSAGRGAMIQQLLASMNLTGRTGGLAGLAGAPGMPSISAGMVDPSQLPTVTLLSERKQVMTPSMSQIAHTETKGGLGSTGPGATSMLMSLGSQALQFAAMGGGGMMAGPALGMATSMIGGFGGMGHRGPPKTTHVWALAGRASEHPMTTRSPKFEVLYGDLLGLDPEAYEPTLVKLVQTKDNWRLVGATKVQMGREETEALEKLTEARVPVKSSKNGRGQVSIEPAAPLEPGEYGLVLRSLHPGKRAKGSLGGPAEQNAFFSVWDFSIPGALAGEAAKAKR